MKWWQNLSASILLLTILFVFVSPMFVVPATALRAYRIAVGLMFLLTVAVMTVATALVAIPSDFVREVRLISPEPDPLAQTCEMRC